MINHKRKKQDFYFKQAKLNNYRSRAAYKIIEILSKFSVLKKGTNFIELGSAPGGWTQILRKELDGKLIALDLQNMKHIPNVQFYKTDFLDFTTEDQFYSIFSDMAPNTTGDVEGDHYRIVDLNLTVLNFAKRHLKNNGNCVIKTFAGPEDTLLLSNFRKCFKQIKSFKPKSSMKDSKEYYLIAMGYKGISEKD